MKTNGMSDEDTLYYRDMDIAEPVLKGILDAGYESPMPIQAKSLPITLAGGNVTGQAQTGSGKTAAFLIAALHRLVTHDPPDGRREQDPRVLVLAPTRELVRQIADEAEKLAKHTDCKVHAVFGGVDYDEQRQQFGKGVDVLIGTPGRLIDYYKQKIYSLNLLEIIIVDECDRMFDMGFIDDVRWMIRRMPAMEDRQNLLFSATMDPRVRELAWEDMDHPQIVAVDDINVPPEEVDQKVYHVGKDEKDSFLIGLLRKEMAAEESPRVLIFVNWRNACVRVSDLLLANGIQSMALSGALTQKQRFKALNAFKEETPPVIVATDVASRGLDIDNVTHVINYDLPDNPKDYVHRVGRTARAGATGIAITMASEDTVENLPKIEETVGKKIDVEWAEDDMFVDIVKPKPRPRSKSGKPGGRGGNRRGGPGGGDRRRSGGRGRRN